MTIQVFGHKSPDTDTVVAAIAAAELLRARGFKAEPRIPGEPNAETKFVLEQFKLPVPEKLDTAAGAEVAVVDTTEPNQLLEDIDKANVKFIFDHHNLGGLKTSAALEIWTRPYGSTCTVLLEAFKHYEIKIPANIAGAMLCAVLSDVVMFKSPTTTDKDRTAVEELSKIAGVKDYMGLGMDMLRVKSAIGHMSVTELATNDFKEFSLGGKTLGIGQIELIDATLFESKREAVKAEMKKIKAGKGYWGMLLLVTDIMKEGSFLFAETDDNVKVGGLLGANFKDGEAWVPGLLSRKKQIVPPLTSGL